MLAGSSSLWLFAIQAVSNVGSLLWQGSQVGSVIGFSLPQVLHYCYPTISLRQVKDFVSGLVTQSHYQKPFLVLGDNLFRLYIANTRDICQGFHFAPNCPSILVVFPSHPNINSCSPDFSCFHLHSIAIHLQTLFYFLFLGRYMCLPLEPSLLFSISGSED